MFKIPVIKERIKLKNKAVQKPFTLKPLTILSANNIIIAFITNKNNPKVITVTGIVNSVKMGLITVFKKANTIATKMAEK